MIKIRLLLRVVLLLATGIFEALRSVNNLIELEERIQRLTQEAALTLLAAALEEIDRMLCAQRDVKRYQNVGLRSRVLVTSVGEVRFRRRLYRDLEKGEACFLLDQALGLGRNERLSPRMLELAVELGTEMPFRRASHILGYLVPGVSAMTVWGAVQESGSRAAARTQALRASVFEKGELPAGTKEISQLFIEADGVAIKQQRAQTRAGEVKLVVGYEGKEGRPRRLKERYTVAGVAEGDTIWEEASAAFGERWALDRVERVRIGGDGANWIKRGKELFPQATYHLDPFHLRRRLTEALAFSEEAYLAVAQGIEVLNREAALERALRRAPGRLARQRVRDLKRYLMDNWEGISALPEEERLGAIEGQVRHTLARRMKRNGARWTPRGADHMARLLAARANGELGAYAGRARTFCREVLADTLGEEVVERPGKVRVQDLEGWLWAKVPALKGPFAGRPWIKYVLRELVSVRWPATL